MFKKILLVLLLVIAGFAVYVAMLPPDFKVERSAMIAAPAADVFAQVNNFHNWDAWSPWAKLDPKAKNTFEGAESGVGAKFAWDGNSDVGAGSMEIIESKPAESIKIDLRFTKPMEGTNLTQFTFKPDGEKTNVTWTMTGKSNFIGRAMCVFMNMDKMVGGKFEEGLNNLKNIVEPKK